MPNKPPFHIKSISQYHQLMGLPKPQHPLVSVVRFDDIKTHSGENKIGSIMFDYYTVALKKVFHGKMRYGQQEYDFDEGVLAFMQPKQIMRIDTEDTQAINHSGWLLIVHPDFLWNTSLAKKITQYDFFDYSLHEALHLSEKEEAMLIAIMQNIEQEYHANIDNFSQDVIIAQLELLLTYAERFYQRQFITRKISNHKTLGELEEFLSMYFDGDTAAQNGIPTVQQIAEALHLSPNYLSRLLKTLTGQSTKQFVQDKLIAKAKEQLSTTDLSVSEIAYALGFEHAQSFSKLFKAKTNASPLAFRASFN